MFLRPQATGCPAPRRMVAHRHRCFSGAFGRLSAGYLGVGGVCPSKNSKDAENPPARCRRNPCGRARYLSPKARHTVGTHTGTKPNNRHLPQVTASKPSSGQPAAGSGTNRRLLEGRADRLGGIHQVTQRLLGLLVITSLQTTVRVHPQVSNGAVTNRSLQ